MTAKEQALYDRHPRGDEHYADLRTVKDKAAKTTRGITIQIRFHTDELRRLAEDPSYKPKRWNHELIRAYRKKISILHSATDERDLYAIRSLHLEQLSGNRADTSSIRLNKQFRLILRFITEIEGRTVIVVELVDYHQKKCNDGCLHSCRSIFCRRDTFR
nr:MULTISPECIES: type II toxin-antitoxin system RelE/ParE family toxin [unclassified Corynebacterium]